jgi:methylated-DNA-protein-cysteine methyltransferase related protein
MPTHPLAERIWHTVLVIPKGKVATYGQIADLAGLPGRARYVSKALTLAPPDLQVPWHRVLRSNGQIAFIAGSENAHLQAHLLREEVVEVLKNKVNLKQYIWQPDLGELLFKLKF